MEPWQNHNLEGQQIANLINANFLKRGNATPRSVQQYQRPKVLHIASHAFFRPQKDINIEHPLLSSGIVLAGANNPESNPLDDGYLTSLEITNLNLQGTNLVVISACVSGQGFRFSGEGVYGLKRAIAVAGAKSNILALWEVDDAATSVFMTNFYQRLKNGETKYDALKNTQKDFKNSIIKNPDKKDDWSHPYYWAAFVLSGDWREIDSL